MRILVVANDAGARAQRAAEVARAGREACAASTVAGLTAQVRAARPDVLLLVTAGGGEARLAVKRARAAAERPLPVLLLPATSTWPRAGVPEDLRPAAALVASEADGPAIRDALAALASWRIELARTYRAGPLMFAPRQRLVEGSCGRASLTASEGALLAALCEAGSEARGPASIATIAEALWGVAVDDRPARAAVRAHVRTLRRKLAAVGAPDAVEVHRGVGYWLVLEVE